MEENSSQSLPTGSIAWGFIWRLIVWTVLAALVFGLIVSAAFLPKATGIHTIDQFKAFLSQAKTYLWVTLIVGVFTSFLGCMLALDGLSKKFRITKSNVESVCQIVTIILIIFACLYVFYVYNNYSNTQATFEEAEQYSKAIIQQYNDNSFDEFLSFTKTFMVIAVVVNIAVYVGLIFFQKNYLLKRAKD